MDTALSLPSLPAPRIPALAERALQHQAGHSRTEARPDVDESKVDPATRAKIRKSANEFETMFVNQMLGHMLDSVPVDDTFGGGQGEEMFRSMLNEQYGKQITGRGGLGIADQVYRELLRAQEGSHGQG
ncbi:rod-binding protein [Azospirillum soli]|uniref:rod-binding protein n=1 Tax=Azospirillum soli TaxID=1304799 RepID=UPI001AE69C0A|nr:rod-binding protein [Azospirillum soli]MBP2311916.1 Rod binding domain-containing protein [Azospirillum soli]